jgi:N-acetylmuramoyl-L-alanine amidase
MVKATNPAVVKLNPPASQAQEQAQASPFRLAPRKPEPRHKAKKSVIFIDPGHGGVDPGTIGISGVYEKHITLAMARELKRQLERTGRFKVILSRSRDVFMRLRDRVRLARDRKAELFISIHADTVRNRKIKGPAVYTLSEKSSDKEAQELAEKENKADLIAGVDLTFETPEVTNILIDLAQRESMNQSARFAASLIRELKRKTRVLRNTHRFAGFAVLKAPDIPSVLVELGFLSNPSDERRLRSKSYRRKLASAMSKAVAAHFVRIEEAARK